MLGEGENLCNSSSINDKKQLMDSGQIKKIYPQILTMTLFWLHMMGKGSDCLIYVILPRESLKCYEIPYKEEI